MRTTAPDRILRSRPVTVTAAALLAAGLVVGAIGTVDTAAAQSAAQSAADTTWQRTSSNMLATPYFENRISPWVGSHLTRQRLYSKAPEGRLVARVGNRNHRVAIDDWPGEVKTVAGWRYRASIKVAAVNWQANKRPIHFVIREHDSHGNYIASVSGRVRLRYWFKQMILSLVAKHTGDTIDVYAYVGGSLRPMTAFFMDSAYIWSAKPQLPTPPPPPPPGDAPSTLGLLAYGTGQPTALGNTSRYRYVVVQENQYGVIPEIKRMNPDTKVLAYMNTSADSRTDCSADGSNPHLWGASFGINYCWVNRYHPDWFLKDRYGNRLHFSDYPFAMQLDMGDPSFADAWAAGVYANASKDGFDGIWIDDLNIDPGHGLNGRIAKYTDEQFGAASTRWGSQVGDYLRSHGMLVIANVGMQPWIQYRLDDTVELGKHLTAVNREHYVRWGDICGPFSERFNTTASNGTPPLSTFFNETNLLQAQGTKFTGVDYGYSTSTSDDLATMTYGRALFLLSWDGTAGSAYFFRSCGVNDTAAPEWTASIGLPTGPVETQSDGLLVRTFQHGVVVLNPNRTGSAARASIPAGLHTMSGATEDGGVYVAPQTAAILSS